MCHFIHKCFSSFKRKNYFKKLAQYHTHLKKVKGRFLGAIRHQASAQFSLSSLI